MKKFLLTGFVTASLFAGFLPGKTYNCENIGLSFRDSNITRNIPNNKQTQEELKKTLKTLYSIKIKLDKNNTLDITSGNKTDKLIYIKKYNSLDAYITKDKQAVVFLDSNHTQVGLLIPSQNTMIYYQCK